MKEQEFRSANKASGRVERRGAPGWLSGSTSAFGSGRDPKVLGSSPALGSYRKPNVGLDPRTPGSCLEPTADVEPLSHPGGPGVSVRAVLHTQGLSDIGSLLQNEPLLSMLNVIILVHATLMSTSISTTAP